MPNVGGVEYPYTPEGVAAAQEHARQIQMSPPMTSPSHPMAQRQTQDLQPYPLNSQGRNQNALAYSMGTPSYYIPDDPSSGIRGMRYGNPLGMSPSSPWYSSVPGQPSISRQPQILEWSGSNFTNDPFDPAGNQPTRNMLPPQAVGPAPRGNVIETSGPANYGSSPSNPNWGQDTGGRSFQKMGPQMLPQSNVQAISPQNRINANIRAVMSGQQGPSPGTSPTGQAPARPSGYRQNQFGPTGQPVSRTPLQKDNMVNNVVKQLPGG